MTSTRPKRTAEKLDDGNPVRSASPLPGGVVRSSGRDRKPVKDFAAALGPAADIDATAAANNNHTATTSTSTITNTAVTHNNPPTKRSTNSHTNRKPTASTTSPATTPNPPILLPLSTSTTSTHPPPKRTRQFDPSSGEELFCLCRQPYDSRRFMIGCDECDGWYHAKCVNLSRLEAEASTQWRCPDCVRRDAVGGGAGGGRAEGRRRAGKAGKNGKRKDGDGAEDDDVADEIANGVTRYRDSHPAVREERREDELMALDEAGGGAEVVRMDVEHRDNGDGENSAAVKAKSSNRSKDRDRSHAGKSSSSSGKDKSSLARSEKPDKLQKAKRKREREKDKSGTASTMSDKDRKRDSGSKKADRDPTSYGSSSSALNGLPSKRRDRDDDDSKKRRRVDRDDAARHADSKSERRRDRDRSAASGVALSDSEASELEEARYSWLEKEERDSSSGEEDVYMTSEDDVMEAEADDADIDGVLIERDESANFDDWRRGGLNERKTMEEDEEESALEALSVKPLMDDERPDVVPFSSIALRGRTLLSPFSMSAVENTREVFLSSLLPDNDAASLSVSSLSSSTSPLLAISSANPISPSAAQSSAADFTMSSPPSVDDLDHLHLHRLHNAKMRVECDLLRLEQDRRVYLAGVDYSARMSVLRTVEAFDRRATESVLLEEVELDEEATKDKERERERAEIEAVGRPGASGAGAMMDVMASPRVVFPFTPRPPSLSRRQSTASLTSLPSFSLPSDSISPPLYGTTLTCCGCDGLIPVAIYHQHLLDCAMTSQEAGQQDWIHEAMTYISGQWEEGRPIGGGDQRKKVPADSHGNLAGAVGETKRKDRNKASTASIAERSSDDRIEGRAERTTVSERQSEKERERILQREAAYNRQHLKSNPTPVGTAANRIQGLLPLPPLLHPYPTTPLIRPLRHRAVAATRHSADWERDRDRQQERDDEMRREERRRGTKHDKHSLALNSVSGRFPLQLSHLRLVCGYPMASSGAGQQSVYCSREKRECTEHLLWEEVEKVRVEQRYWQLSRRLEMLKAELEPVQFRVSERVMCEADVIGQVLGDSILVEEAEDENLKEETERMVVLVKRRREEEDKTTQFKVERQNEEKDKDSSKPSSSSSSSQHNDAKKSASATATSPTASTAAPTNQLSSDTTKATAHNALPPAVTSKLTERRSSTDMDADEHEGFAMSTTISDVDHGSPIHWHVHPTGLPRYKTPPPEVMSAPFGWMNVIRSPRFLNSEPATAAAHAAAAAGSGGAGTTSQAAASATLPPPPPTHPQPLRVQTADLGPVAGAGAGLGSGLGVMGSASSGSAFSPPGRSASAAAAAAADAAVDGGIAAVADGNGSVGSTRSLSSASSAASSPAAASSPSSFATPSKQAGVPSVALPPPPPPPPFPVPAALAMNANPTIPRLLAPATLVSPSNSLTQPASALSNGIGSVTSSVDAGGSKHLDGATPPAAAGPLVVTQPIVTAVAT